MEYRLDLCLPELALLAMVAVLFVQSINRPTSKSAVAWAPYGAGVVLAVSALCVNFTGETFAGAYKFDLISQMMKAAIAFGFLVVSSLAVKSETVEAEKLPDYLMLLGLSAWGLMLLSSSVELMTIYISLEISSYSLYAVIPLRAQDKRAAEAGVKYILFGAVATAISLYGFSLILGSQHTSYINELAGMSWSFTQSPAAAVGLILFLCGVFFKLALFPFHFWAPDVYQGASNETAAFAATLPKLGAVAVLVRMGVLLQPGVETTTIIAVLAAISMTYGNLAALAQKDLKRMLGYSGVAHAGYMMLGLVSGTAEGLGAAAFYVSMYLLMNLACFWVVCRLAPGGENLTYDDLDGLHRRSPALALILAISAFSLVGLPPTVGFVGKLFLLSSAWGHGYDWLVIIAAVNAAFAIYYYLSLVRHAYTNDGDESAPAIKHGFTAMMMGGVMAAGLLLLGAMPGSVYRLALEAGKMLMP